MGENYNVLKSENTRVSQCPKEKEEATKAILKYYAMILRISMISRRNNRREKFFWELFPIIKKYMENALIIWYDLNRNY